MRIRENAMHKCDARAATFSYQVSPNILDEVSIQVLPRGSLYFHL